MAKGNSEPDLQLEDNGRLGIFGGMFDPPHNGHFVACQTAREELNLDRVLLVPALNPPHKSTPATGPEDRLEMVKSVTGSNPDFKTLEVEVDMGGVSYTVETLVTLRKRYRENDLTLIVGADELRNFTDWHRWKEILELADLAATTRAGLNPSDYLARLPEPVSENCRLIEIPGLDISSTGLRNRLEDGRSIRYLTPEPVRKIIREKNLYHD